MELKSFIKTVLNDLIQAIDETTEELCKQNRSLVCPPLGNAIQQRLDIKLDAHGRYHQNIEFDIAVTASDEANNEGKAGVKVLGVSIGADMNSTSSNSVVSRVKFHVPIAFQCMNLKNSE